MCFSEASPGRIMEGASIKLDVSPPEGWSLGIVTPWALEERYAQYDEELSSIFENIVRCLQNENLHQDAMKQEAVRYALRLFYYWINFTPTTRGSAVAGYAALLAIGMLL